MSKPRPVRGDVGFASIECRCFQGGHTTHQTTHGLRPQNSKILLHSLSLPLYTLQFHLAKVHKQQAVASNSSSLRASFVALSSFYLALGFISRLVALVFCCGKWRGADSLFCATAITRQSRFAHGHMDTHTHTRSSFLLIAPPFLSTEKGTAFVWLSR